MTDIDFVRTKADFTKAEKKLINYIITNPDDFIHMTIGDVAEAVGISLPTVSRFARHCGYADFKELSTPSTGIFPKTIPLPESSVQH